MNNNIQTKRIKKYVLNFKLNLLLIKVLILKPIHELLELLLTKLLLIVLFLSHFKVIISADILIILLEIIHIKILIQARSYRWTLTFFSDLLIHCWGRLLNGGFILVITSRIAIYKKKKKKKTKVNFCSKKIQSISITSSYQSCRGDFYHEIYSLWVAFRVF